MDKDKIKKTIADVLGTMIFSRKISDEISEQVYAAIAPLVEPVTSVEELEKKFLDHMPIFALGSVAVARQLAAIAAPYLARRETGQVVPQPLTSVDEPPSIEEQVARNLALFMEDERSPEAAAREIIDLVTASKDAEIVRLKRELSNLNELIASLEKCRVLEAEVREKTEAELAKSRAAECPDALEHVQGPALRDKLTAENLALQSELAKSKEQRRRCADELERTERMLHLAQINRDRALTELAALKGEQEGEERFVNLYRDGSKIYLGDGLFKSKMEAQEGMSGAEFFAGTISIRLPRQESEKEAVCRHLREAIAEKSDPSSLVNLTRDDAQRALALLEK